MQSIQVANLKADFSSILSKVQKYNFTDLELQRHVVKPGITGWNIN